MYHHVVMTCGISLIQGNSYFSFSKDGEFKDIVPRGMLQKNIAALTEDLEKKISCFLDQARLHFPLLSEHPESISAEYSLIYALKKERKLANRPSVTLFFTETIGGYICEKLLSEIFAKENINVKTKRIQMTVSDEKELKNETTGFLKKLGDALSEGEPGSTCFAPLGGYKILTALGYLVGSFLKYPMVYLHEQTQILVEIPPVPLGIDREFLQEHGDLLRRCYKDYVGYEELSFPEQQIVDHYPAIFSKEEGLVSLSPFGFFLFEWKDYPDLFGTRYLLSAQARRFIKNNGHLSRFISEQLQELAKKLKNRVSSDDLRHELQFKQVDPKKLRYFLYKGASKGQRVFRCTYQYDDRDDVLYINYIWYDHDDYEKEVSKGTGLYADEKDFRDYTDHINQAETAMHT